MFNTLAQLFKGRRRAVKEYLFHPETSSSTRLAVLMAPLHDPEYDGPLLALSAEEAKALRLDTTRAEKLQLLFDFWYHFMIEDGMDGSGFDNDFMDFMEVMEAKHGTREVLARIRAS
jgi:hypothetical protein